MQSSRKLGIIQGVNLIAYVVVVIINSIAGATGLNGKTTGAISNSIPNLFTPAGYVFSIWGVIYILLAIFVIFQLLPSQRNKPFHLKINYFFILSCIANIIWLFLWHYNQPVISLLAMFVLLGLLISIYRRLGIGLSEVSLREKLCVHLPFSVYLGWITVAPIANVSAALVVVGWNGFGLSAVTWTDLVIIIALIITLAVIFTRRDIAYGLVIIWAVGGILVKQSNEQSIVLTAAAASIIIAVAVIAVGIKKFMSRSKK
jgi:benzodiazapine receptor